MDYSKFVHAIKSRNHREIEKFSKHLFPILCNSLMGRMGASREDAEDAVQNMFAYLLPRIEENRITTPDGLLDYMQIASKHSYLNMIRTRRKDNLTYLEEDPSIPPNQIWNLIDEEQENRLQACINQMKGHFKSLIQFMLEYPDATPNDIADYFKITIANVWIRKHRVIKQLQDCMEKYM